MAKNRYNQAVTDYTSRVEKEKPKEVTLTFSPCVNCGNAVTQGFYGRHNGGGTCSRKCELEQEKKPKYWGEPK